MSEPIIFAITIFIGWLIFDFVKHKKLTKELVIGALIVAIIAGLGWFVLDLLF
ncbi:hypothetical protein [Bacillus sp. FJAT-45350]|uniref:hypothetical protein n=1 Tax=Bacillus sp. FJAT-45350 TaxID=2011014 RepID=UPI0015C86C64|nr:hypothetical protein [Bacillus sp. FJAT-45350]